ncbi:hypothetical protein FQN60_003453 [Etheostoma spectabile]|uniref:PDZ domain-containing protein n=1 Tax=Etheostoma spectabile TaxID=54343 RepID=A0A5J5CUK2_9PERO|nr:hypothetical protein FQN60_003453 [Etheostoma spectabile]
MSLPLLIPSSNLTATRSQTTTRSARDIADSLIVLKVLPCLWPQPGQSLVLDAMSDTTTSSTTANDLDLIYLKGIMESPLEQEESLKEPRPSPVRENNVELLQEILSDLDPFTHHSDTAAELTRILTQPHFKACDSPPSSPCDFVDNEQEDGNKQNVPPDAIRMVGIRKVAGENLGVTFKVEGGELIIARILHGGMIDQQGLLHVGDIIKEVFFKCHYDYDRGHDT